MHPDIISCTEAGTLPGLLLHRIASTPDAVAYRQYDATFDIWKNYTWRDIGAWVARWQQSLQDEGLAPGDRVAIQLNNSVEWVCFDQAALSLGLVVVPLYTSDNPENAAYILADCGARLLLADGAAQWRALAPHQSALPELKRVLCLECNAADGMAHDARLVYVKDWLSSTPASLENHGNDPHALATIVYTSGTTGRPKGVMLSHHNILWDAEAVLQVIPGYAEDVFLSFLPLSHTFERTVGYYLPVMCGSCVAYTRSAQTLPEDLLIIRPTILVAVPRIFERVYLKVHTQLQEKGAFAQTLFRWAEAIGWQRFEAAQGRAARIGFLQRMAWPLLRWLVADKIISRLGGRIRIAVSGGAPLPKKISHAFVGLGLPLVQGYGLTEASPVVAANRLQDNIPESVGAALPGVETRIGEHDELLVRAPSVMLGYWNQPQDTRDVIDADGWLHTGDQARVVDGHIYISGRLKEIIVTATGEKAPPASMEMAITLDPLFEQAMVVGEGKPCLAALIVLNRTAWRDFATMLALDPDDPAALQSTKAERIVLAKLNGLLSGFPRHAQVRKVHLLLDAWTIENGLMTPTLKLKRDEIEKRYAAEIQRMYAGHGVVQ